MYAVCGNPAIADPLIDSALRGRTDIVGSKVQIEVGAGTAVALHRPGQLARNRGAALILHAPGSNADDPAVVRALRLGLSDAGWDTLAVQLPTRFVSESAQQWLARNDMLAPQITAATQWLEARGRPTQVLLGVGASGLAALAFGTAQPATSVQAIALISTPIEADTAAATQLTDAELPILDLFAERDLPRVLHAAPLKRRLARNNSDYRQRTVVGANPGYVGLDRELVSTVRAWLAGNADDR